MRAVTEYVPGIRPKGEGWIKLNTNENPFPPSPKVIEAIKATDLSKLPLYPDPDSKELATAIAAIFGISAECVFVGNGSDEVLALAFQAFFSGYKEVLMPEISYGFYPVWAQMYDVGARQIPLCDWTIDVADYKDANGVCIANPNAPTGIALTLGDICELAQSNPNGIVIVDEAYLDFSDIESAISLIDRYKNLLVVRTFSKSHSLAGLRVGFAVGNAELINRLLSVKNAFNSYPLDSLAQIGARAAIEDIDYWNDTRREVIATREQTIESLRGLGLRVLPSSANFVLVHVKNARGLYEYLLSKKVLVRFWDTPKLCESLRITIGTDKEMEVLLSCVTQWLHEKQKKQK